MDTLNRLRQDFHTPVMLAECLEALNVQSEGIYMDGTFGRGGHSQAILSRLGALGRLIVVDQDPDAIAYAEKLLGSERRCHIYHRSYTSLKEIAEKEGILGKVSGILLDLGVSSAQLEEPKRGFSFLREGPLDMRMDPRSPLDAATWINQASQADISHVLFTYGEERYARRIAEAIVKARMAHPFKTTIELASVVKTAHPAWPKDTHPATRSFQAIRIFINGELQALNSVLADVPSLLMISGRLVVLSFHSLEDRIVKRFVKGYEENPIPRSIPIRGASGLKRMQAVGRMMKASAIEVQTNVRARSARLRIGEKII